MAAKSLTMGVAEASRWRPRAPVAIRALGYFAVAMATDRPLGLAGVPGLAQPPTMQAIRFERLNPTGFDALPTVPSLKRGVAQWGVPAHAADRDCSASRQNSCRFHRPTQGAAMKDGLGSMRTDSQRQSGGAVVRAGERGDQVVAR